MNGLLLVDKPAGITSFDVIRQLRRITGASKIGHTGTLDPAATGLMLMLFGSATKQAARFSKLDKSYEAEITLGATSTTGDKEGVIIQVAAKAEPTLGAVSSAVQQFVGDIEQTPPVFSAVKIAGQEAYKRARRGETIEMPTRTVTIHALQIISYEYPILKITASVSSGTYIRSVAADIGAKLGCGGYLSALRRTQVGEFKIEDALELESADARSVRESLKTLEA